jgi:hypothetical protein
VSFRHCGKTYVGCQRKCRPDGISVPGIIMGILLDTEDKDGKKWSDLTTVIYI